MLRAFRSEWIKIRRRSVLIGGAAMSFFAVVAVYFSITRATSPGNPLKSLTIARLQSGQGLTLLLGRGADIIDAIALILVSAATAAEYSQGTLRNLLVRESGRLRFLAGKYAALLVFTLLAATVAVVVASAVGLVAAPAHGLDTTAWTSSNGITQWRDFYGNLLIATTAWTVLGLFCALVFRSSAAAVGVALAYGLAVEALISNVWLDAPKWLYGRQAANILNGGDPDIGSYGRSLLIVGAYAAVMLVAGAVLFRVRDVTA